jgi:hypothetical protein
MMNAHVKVFPGSPQQRCVLLEGLPDHMTRTFEIVGAQDLEVR